MKPVYQVVCRDCGIVLETAVIVVAQDRAQTHATTPRRGTYHHNVTVREA